MHNSYTLPFNWFISNVISAMLQALCDLGRFEDANNEFETAIKLEPDNANTLVHRA